ncbi:MAG: nicotinate (nicotinamide) nucleotide adenylyltransferase [Candidatus Dadabacteria bacterium]|nr:MAG: nicotinate (nicotinamide) nucleotide adenylyltransferase [Candidatus Dadabacteria bacterium]
MTVRYGVFGGAFDPPHNGHLSVAREAVAQLSLDRLLLVVAAQSPLKPPSSATPDQRLEMARRLAQLVPRADACGIELRQDGPSYTIDTMKALRARLQADEWWLIIGADQFVDFARWRSPDALLRRANLAVFPRPGYEIDVRAVIRNIEQVAGICYDTTNDGQEWNLQRRDDHDATTRIRVLHMTPVSLSSTEIRATLAAGKSIDGLVPETIANWIRAQHLYAPSAPADHDCQPVHQRKT